jgi:hypothetical protein
MRSSISKTVLAGLSASLCRRPLRYQVSPPRPFNFIGGGFGGFHGEGGFGGFHPGLGGFHSGFVHRPGFFRHGFVNRHVFFVGGPGGWCDGWWWPGLATGAIVGAAAAYPYNDCDYGYGYGYGNDNGCWAYRALYNRHGHYIGRHLVNLCY